MSGLLEGKVAVITGGAQGIGFNIGKRMAENGAHVALLDIKEEVGRQSAAELEKLGVKAKFYYLDVVDVPSIKPLFAKIEEEFGTVDILVNNAGICKVIPIAEMTVEDWDLMMNINLRSGFFCSQAAFAIMKKHRWGRIINLSSIAGQRGGRFTGTNYSASKAGVLGMTKALALNGAEFNITVNALAPGLIDTAMNVELGLSGGAGEVALGRMGDPYEVAGAAVFLASDLADYLTGITIDVNGGQYMH